MSTPPLHAAGMQDSVAYIQWLLRRAVDQLDDVPAQALDGADGLALASAARAAFALTNRLLLGHPVSGDPDPVEELNTALEALHHREVYDRQEP